jgi:hypothetical protein
MKKIDRLCSELAQAHMSAAKSNVTFHNSFCTTYVEVYYNEETKKYSVYDGDSNHLGDYGFDNAENLLAKLIKTEIVKSLNLA